MTEKYNLEKIKHTPSDMVWSVICKPNEDSIDYLKRKYKFHHLDLEDCLSEQQRPKIDDYDDYLFLVLHAPLKTSSRKKLIIAEFNIFIGQDFVIVLHDNYPTIKKIFENCQKNKKTRDEYLGKGSGYLLYKLIDQIFEDGFPILDSFGKHINELEVEVFDKKDTSDRLREILLLKKDLINFRRIIMPQRTIIAQLEHKNKKFIPEDLDVYFDDIVDKIEKMWNNLENLQELVSSLQETNESIISHNTNNIIKILTLFSVVMLPLTLITGFYGMNVNGLPFAEDTASVQYIGGIFLGVIIVMVGYFRYKRWL